MTAAKVWMITGAGRGIGAALAKAVLAAGDRVAATGRDPARIESTLGGPSERLMTIRLDVTKAPEATRAAAAAVERFGRIDVLVNNAGYALLGAFEECTDAEIEAQFRTNVFGVWAVTRAVLPFMREQRRGHVINMSSMLGFKAGPGASAYCSSKFAVEGLTEAMTRELAPLGIHTTAIEPGYIRTDFLEDSSLQMAFQRIADYDATAGLVREQATAHSGKQVGDPEKVAQAILTIARSDSPPRRLALGRDAVDVIEKKLAAVRQELSEWRELSVSIAYDS